MVPTITQSLLDAEIELYKQDRERFYCSETSKPDSYCEPFLMYQGDSKVGVLLIHGFMAAPEEVRQWAEHLYAMGLTVFVPRLAGHGTTVEDLSGRHYREWCESVDRGHAILKSCTANQVVAGFSAGGGLALTQVIQKPNQFKAVISVSAPQKFSSLSAKAIRPLNRWNQFLAGLRIPFARKEYVTNHADNPHINYGLSPIQGLAQVKRMMKRVEKSLQEISIPCLIIQGDQDPKVSPSSGKTLFEGIASPNKKYAEVACPIHGIVRDEVGQAVFKHVEMFLNTTVLNST